MTRAPRWMLILTLLLSVGLTLTAGVDIARSASGGFWYRVALQVTIILAGAMGVGIGMGRFRAASAWASATVGATVVIAAYLASMSGGAGQGAGFGLSGTIKRLRMDPPALIELLAGLGILAIAGLSLMLRAPGVAFARLFAGVGLLIPVVAGVWMFWRGPWSGWALSLHPIAQAVLALVGFLIALVLISAGGHLVIRALEADRPGTTSSDA